MTPSALFGNVPPAGPRTAAPFAATDRLSRPMSHNRVEAIQNLVLIGVAGDPGSTGADDERQTALLVKQGPIADRRVSLTEPAVSDKAQE